MVYVWHASTWQPLIPVFLSLFLSPLLSPLLLPPWPSPTDHVQQSICDDSQRPNCGGEGRAREGKRDSHWCQWEQAKDHQCSSTEHGGTWVDLTLIPRPPTWPENEAGSTYPHIVHNLLALNPPLHPHTLTLSPPHLPPHTLHILTSAPSHPHRLARASYPTSFPRTPWCSRLLDARPKFWSPSTSWRKQRSVIPRIDSIQKKRTKDKDGLWRDWLSLPGSLAEGEFIVYILV